MPDQVYRVFWNGQLKADNSYDALGRLGGKFIWTDRATIFYAYSYEDVGENQTSTLVSSVRTPFGLYQYTYDAVGNITSVAFGTKYTNTYAYDSLNQLVRENNQQIGKTYTYTYVNGNITERKEYAYTTGELGEALDTKIWSYTDASWSDLLTSYNGISISYDEIGNPTAIGSQSLSWNGRQLQQIVDGTNTYSYAYNTDGQRVSKTVNGVTTEYFYNGSILAGQKTGDDTLVFMYDNNGDPFGFVYNDETYYYVKNVQNDVFGITDHNRVLLVNYAYDAWGKVVSVTDADGNEITDMSHIGHINPIRYRSYYYDGETNLYYLNSRYYSPDICRFLNADSYASTNQGILGQNMFAYCLNNPVAFLDPNGNFSVSIPAEGPGTVTVALDPGEESFTLTQTDGTYTLSVTPSSGGTGGGSSKVSDVLSSMSSGMLEETINCAINAALASLTYQNFAQITNFTNAASGAVKNICATFNNSLYTLISPYLNDMKIVGKTYGFATIAAFAVDVIMDYNDYGTDFNNLMVAYGIDLFFIGASVLAGAMIACAPATMPVIGVVALTVISGTVLGWAQAETKRYFLG